MTKLECTTTGTGVKYTRFQDIPQLTRSGSWQCHFTIKTAVQQVRDWVTEQHLNIDPDFQRFHVWNEAQQIAWLEFILRGGKTGRVLYFNDHQWTRPTTNYSEFLMVDGKQRFEAMRRFIDGEIKVYGSAYAEYTDWERMANSKIELCVNDLSSRAAVLQWYIEMNSGGTQHTPEEIEKARLLLAAEVAPGEAL